MHTIKRNRKVLDYLDKQIKRLRWDISLTKVFNEYIFEGLSIVDSKELFEKIDDIELEITNDLLDNDALFIETVKFIGLMEVCVNEDELLMLIKRRKEIKYGSDLTDFDKIIKAIMTVPNKEKD